MIKVSVIIPVYNVEKYLRRCLDSVIAQTLREIEIICVNDVSPDNCALILAEYAEKDHRIRVINHAKNQGQGIARDTGIAAAKGSYIGFIDSDDWVDARMYEVMYNQACADNADMLVCGTRMVSEGYKLYFKGHDYITFTEKYSDRGIKYLQSYFNGFDNPAMKTVPFIGVYEWNKLVKRELILNNKLKHLPNVAGPEDSYMTLNELFFANTVTCIPDVFYNYYQGNTASVTKNIDFTRMEIEFVTWQAIYYFLKTNKLLSVELVDSFYKYVLRMLYGNSMCFISIMHFKKSFDQMKTIANLIEKFDFLAIYKYSCPQSKNLLKMLVAAQNNDYLSFKKSLQKYRLQTLKYKYISPNLAYWIKKLLFRK